MDNQNDSKHFVEIEHKRTDVREEFLYSDDDDLAFVPIENIRIIERVILNLKDVKQRLNNIRP